MHFITRAMPINDIDGTEKHPQLSNELFEVKVTPLVIYGLGAYTHTCMYTLADESDYKKPGVHLIYNHNDCHIMKLLIN